MGRWVNGPMGRWIDESVGRWVGGSMGQWVGRWDNGMVVGMISWWVIRHAKSVSSAVVILMAVHTCVSTYVSK